ncbi:bifunctional methylenetetrahydrofolate dehydrogenase/methenyltetrahydrofolate cyclohydrolase FolD [Leeia sp. TBRC 13508]|uniref:Bifunctional protein FolD n=1 Tax=Leeia speluncae TaxID=2884804 RepID=A0ABS8D2R3_9NEIS|nr:bifunctional methylenetetrahydrofolate dehydrogenase/methenyltetrahydrofolate cyclohydrolase FolD [Leeia speluncae]MCB6182464.1 bifunctional methylenetetrahydrofolate dehydrogenase/methenyltetrahydrofolate cyclohydrolase FolD [Leeia speluncae]
MTARILDGKTISQRIVAQLAERTKLLISQGKRSPTLAVVLVGDNAASAIYVRNKKNACEKAGIRSISHELPSSTTQVALLDLVNQLNTDPEVDGILVQLPLPAHIDADAVTAAIDPAKDVDGFHSYNIGRLAQKMPLLRPCTPKGMMTLLEETGEDLVGKNAVVVGASNIVGRPMALELLMARCTVTVCHSATKELAEHVKRADIVVAAVGRPQFVKGDWIKPGAIVLDVGINRLDDDRITGDVEFEVAKEKASWITPVPGGVGPMTVASLMENTFIAAGLLED